MLHLLTEEDVRRYKRQNTTESHCKRKKLQFQLKYSREDVIFKLLYQVHSTSI